MPKINAVVPEKTRKAMRHLAADHNTTVQAVAALAIARGMDAIRGMGKPALQESLQPDGRRKPA